MSPTYKGSTPIVRCRDVSGADCNRTMRADAEHCGVPEHVRVQSLEKTCDAVFVSRPRDRKPRLTVNEDYSLITPERDLERDRALPDLDPAVFDASNMWVGTRVQRAFTAHHGTDAPTAIDDLRFFITEALAKGAYERLDSGFHRLSYEGFAAVLSPDGAVVTGYSTRHFERTPTQVLGGVPSRFGKRRGAGPRESGPPLPLDELLVIFDASTVEITRTALSLYAARTGLDADDEDGVEAALRSELAQAVAFGTWRPSDRGPTAFVLETPTRHWIVAADRGTILSHYRPGSPRNQASTHAEES